MKPRSNSEFRPYGRSDDMLIGLFIAFEMPRELGHWIDKNGVAHCSVCGAKGHFYDCFCRSCRAKMWGYS